MRRGSCRQLFQVRCCRRERVCNCGIIGPCRYASFAGIAVALRALVIALGAIASELGPFRKQVAIRRCTFCFGSRSKRPILSALVKPICTVLGAHPWTVCAQDFCSHRPGSSALVA
ncbi:MAG: hypothetical protein JWQ49_4811 [Edaphobacter sp.]|nr:hypothetical protein [Edaphobacter sp.]